MKKSANRSRILFWLCLVLSAFVFSLLGCKSTAEHPKSKPAAADPELYAASYADAEVFIPVPSLRQYGSYTCGTTCVQMLLNWLRPYEADLNLAQYETLLGTTEEDGTSPSAVLAFFAEQNVEYTAAEHLSLSDLREKLSAGHPVLLPLQAWSSAEDGSYNTSDPSDADTYLTEGHWVICVGYTQTAERPYFIFNDPACVGHTLLYADELDQRWIDMDGAGKIYDHFGIELTGKTNYRPDGIFHLD